MVWTKSPCLAEVLVVLFVFQENKLVFQSIFFRKENKLQLMAMFSRVLQEKFELLNNGVPILTTTAPKRHSMSSSKSVFSSVSSSVTMDETGGEERVLQTEPIEIKGAVMLCDAHFR